MALIKGERPIKMKNGHLKWSNGTESWIPKFSLMSEEEKEEYYKESIKYWKALGHTR